MRRIIYKRWHDLLGMPKYDKTWHKNDVAAEYQELLEAKGWVNRWSEYSDVTYTVTRAWWSGHDIQSPLTHWQFIYGSAYMFPKHGLRFLFYRRAGKVLGSAIPLREIRNPHKPHKLRHIANTYNLDPNEFTAICNKQLRYWLLLK